jgi:conjugal transfer pilus assembly protein TraK
MFITQKGSEAQALSLTLVPQRIPPRELFLSVGGDAVSPGMFANSKAERWETSQPYVETLRSLLRNVALGELPQGYTLHHTEPKHPKPHCSQPGLDFSFDNGQMLIGHKLTVSIGVARNVSGQPLEFEEASCGEWNVAAVAAFPRNVLAPNDRTEIYVVTKQGQQNAPDQNNRRPSLLGGSQ